MALEPIATRPADARIAKAQIPIGTQMRIGARDWAGSDREGLLQFTAGSGSCKRIVIIRLAADDTYRVDVGRLVKYDWRNQATAQGVYAEQLGETVERLFLAANGE